jgi:hypothetical protein
LYGSLSIVHALWCVVNLVFWYTPHLLTYTCTNSAQLLGPGLLALIFMFTVASVPSAVFLFAALAILFSTLLLGLVQFGKPDGVHDHVREDPMEDSVDQRIDDHALL